MATTPGGSLPPNLVRGTLWLREVKDTPEVTTRVSTKKNTGLEVKLLEIPGAILLAI